MRTRTSLLAAGAAIALALGGGTAYAEIAGGPVDSGGVIHGCYTNAAISGSHVFVLQDASTTCPKGTTAVSWNEHGPAGAIGPAGAAGPAGPAGATGNTGPAGAMGPAGPAGPAGAAGATGPAGPAGPSGQDGTNILTSPAAPTGSCTNGDSDVDLADGEVYTCSSSAWGDSGFSVAGPAGTSGTNGASVLTSPAAPTGSCTNGDSDVDLADGEVYTCSSSAWGDSGSSIEGPQGPAGPAGTGATVSTVSSGDTNCPNGGAKVTDGNGNAGYACNGANGSSSGPLGQDAESVYGTAEMAVPGAVSANSTLIPGLSLTVNVPANALVYVSSDGGAYTTSDVSNGWSFTDIGLFVDGTALQQGGDERLSMLNNANVVADGHWSLSEALQLPAGTHSFAVAADGGGSGSVAEVSGSEGNVDQGTLTVIILHQ